MVDNSSLLSLLTVLKPGGLFPYRDGSRLALKAGRAPPSRFARPHIDGGGKTMSDFSERDRQLLAMVGMTEMERRMQIL